MLVVATLSDTLWFVGLAVACLIFPWVVAFLSSETRHHSSRNQLSNPEKFLLFGIWGISVLGLGAVIHFGETYLGEIFQVLYMLLAAAFTVITLILMLIAASKPE